MFDCALFAATVICAMTGTNLAVWARGKYGTQEGRAAAVGAFATGGLEAVVRRIVAEHGIQEIHRDVAQPGDLCLIDAAADEVDCAPGPVVGICVGKDMVIAAPKGLISRPMARARTCWRI